ncbi:MAG: UDP-N-acetylmuramate dehydrogenase [Demequinaceae bacterium]|nr:UDP-N-acetylmuramate dehydrogenase [Demequinaceae bacterium]
MTLLADLTTLRVGGPARELIEPTTDADLIAAVREADATGTPVLVIGGGSNLLVGDGGFEGVVIRDARDDIDADVTIQDDGFCGGVSVTVAAGVPWDDVVARSVRDGWVGLEALSGIPGSTGATPVQNVGAYGADVAETIASVRTWDRLESRVRTLAAIECGFAYRDSLFKRSQRGAAPDGAVWAPTPRFVVLDVTFQMRFGTRSVPVKYAQLAEALGIEVGGTASTAAVRDAVLELRRSKGMVLDSSDHDTWSAGSFFTNPVVAADVAARLPADAPRYPAGAGAPEGAIKTSAAWLIERAGFGRGFGVAPDAVAALSTKHTLALTNRGGATADDVLALARAVRDGVRQSFGIELIPEPVMVGAQI